MGNRILIQQTSKIAYLVSDKEFVLGIDAELINDLFEKTKKITSNNFMGIITEDHHYIWYLGHAKWNFGKYETTNYNEYSTKYEAAEDVFVRSVIDLLKAQNELPNFIINKNTDKHFYNTLTLLLSTSEYINNGFTWKEETIGNDTNFVLYKMQKGFMNKIFSTNPFELEGTFRLSEVNSIVTTDGRYFEIVTPNKNYLVSLINKS